MNETIKINRLLSEIRALVDKIKHSSRLSTEEKEDIVVDTYMALTKKESEGVINLDNPYDEYKGYMFITIRNFTYMRYNQIKKERMYVEIDDDVKSQVCEQYYSKDYDFYLNKVKEYLTDEEQMVLNLLNDGVKLKDIPEKIGRCIDTCSIRIRTAREKINKLLNESPTLLKNPEIDNILSKIERHKKIIKEINPTEEKIYIVKDTTEDTEKIYYNLSDIARLFNVSRQAVSDACRKGHRVKRRYRVSRLY